MGYAHRLDGDRRIKLEDFAVLNTYLRNAQKVSVQPGAALNLTLRLTEIR